MLGGILSNPDAINKIMTLMPAVAQMMNNGGSNNINQQKIIDTTAANKSPAPNMDILSASTENLMANAEVMGALRNLITAISRTSFENTSATFNNGEIKPDAVPVMAGSNAAETAETGDNNNTDNKIEKTLDTLKNFSSATNPENDRRSKLLLALKPFLKEGRQTKIDTAIKYMNAAKIINMFGKNGFV